MTASSSEGNSKAGTLMSPEEKESLQRVAGGQPPSSQRAQALLAINSGSSQAKAAQNAGLTVGQVKYLMRKFRKNRLGAFPQEAFVAANASTEEQSKTEPGVAEIVSGKPSSEAVVEGASLTLDEKASNDKAPSTQGGKDIALEKEGRGKESPKKESKKKSKKKKRSKKGGKSKKKDKGKKRKKNKGSKEGKQKKRKKSKGGKKKRKKV